MASGERGIMNPDKLLFLFRHDGKECYHEGITYENGQVSTYKCSCMEHQSIEPLSRLNPSFSDPRHRDEFFSWLCKERPEMWEQFLSWALRQYEHPWAWEGKTIPWLFFSDPSRPRDLMAEWLYLDSTIEDFGWEKCPNCEGDKRITLSDGRGSHDCSLCSGSGKVLSAWAKYAKEGKSCTGK